jgi:hypothetical protein
VRDDVRLSSVADSLSASLMFADSDRVPDLSHIAKNPNSNTIPPYLMILWVCLIIVGLAISRFRYDKSKTWK